MSHSPHRPLRFILACALLPGLALLAGLVDPSLQPIDLWERYGRVVSLRVLGADEAAHTAILEVETVHKGAIGGKRVTVETDAALHEVFSEVLQEGGAIVAFIGQVKRGGEAELIFYPGDGRWQSARLTDPNDPSRWQWVRDLDPHQPGSMYGTWNGPPERLRELADDLAAGRSFFPAVASDVFREERVAASLGAPVRGVAIHDLDGDGRADLVACSPAGTRVLLQAAPLRFDDATATLGLDSCPAASVSIADADGDGLPDLLLDDRLWLQRRANGKTRFAEAVLAGPTPGTPPVKSSVFAEMDGDGHPDVVIGRAGGGLTLLLNPGGEGKPWRNASDSAGLRARPDLAGGDGFFLAGDWNGDGHRDLWYGIGSGVLLQQEAGGRFAPAVCPEVDLRTGGKAEGRTGGACAGPFWKSDGCDLFVPSEESVSLLAQEGGALVNVTSHGNELGEGTFGLLTAVAEDLNMDGHVDAYATSLARLAGSYYVNRGYGSFMMPEKYKADVFPGKAHRSGNWGVAAGDVDGDGANDLLLGGLDGTLALLLNGTLALREPSEGSTYHQAVLERTRIVSVDVGHGRGVVGAVLRLRAADGRLLLRRDLAAGAGAGSAGPAVVNLAVREAGHHVLEIAYSDGQRATWPVDCTGEARRFALSALRPAPSAPEKP